MTTPTTTTAVDWYNARTDPPDDDTCVLMWDGDEVFMGYKDGREWIAYEAPLNRSIAVLYWAHIPYPDIPCRRRPIRVRGGQ